MDDNIRSYVSMCEKVDALLVLKATEFAATPAAAAPIRILLRAKIDELLANDTQANLDDTGQAIAKNTERDELNTSTRTCIPFLVKHFKATNNPRMVERINFNKSELESMDDNKFYENAKLVFDTAAVAATLAAIIALGYTNALQTAFGTNVTEFRDLIGTPRMLTGDASSYNFMVKRNYQELHKINEDLDTEVDLIEFSATQLFESYYACRKIDDAGSSGGTASSGTVAPGESKLVHTIIYDPAINIRFENTGSNALAFTLAIGGAPVGTALKITGGNTENHPITDLHTAGDALMVIGDLLGASGYKVTFT